jgi:hypothetical protein
MAIVVKAAPAFGVKWLIPTELIKLIDYRTELPPVLGIWIDVLQVVSKRRKFWT